MEDLREQNELKHEAPVLFGIQKVDPFVVPAGFFDRFPHEVQAMVVRPHTQSGWPVWLKRVAIALPVVALLVGGWWWSSDGRTDLNAALPNIVAPDPNDLSYLDEQDLLASLPEGEMPLLSNVQLDLSEEELAAYVEHEDLDLTEYITEQ